MRTLTCPLVLFVVLGTAPLPLEARDETLKHRTTWNQCAHKFDEYGNIRGNDTKARLDNYAIQLRNNPEARGYMIFYGPRRGRAGIVQRRLNNESGYLFYARGIEKYQVTAVIGGNNEDVMTELWIVPKGCAAPKPAPTVPPNEVVILQYPDVSPERLLILQAVVREFRPLITPAFRRQIGQLSEWEVNITYLRERNDWAWVEMDQSVGYSEDGESFDLQMWGLLRKVNGRWRAMAKRVADRNLANTRREFMRSTMQKNPTAPREIFNTGR